VGKLKTLKVDKGPEFAGRVLDQWAHLNGVEIDSSRPSKPTDNMHSEAFNGRLQPECLYASWFLSLDDARERLEAWRREYNGRPMRRPAAGVTAELDPAGVRRAGSTSPTSCVAPDQSWARDQSCRRTKLSTDRFYGAGHGAGQIDWRHAALDSAFVPVKKEDAH
jgi:hypothetical protein